MGPYINRDCTFQDLEKVLEIERISFDDPYPESLFVSFLEKCPSGFRIAESAGILVGYCVILPWKRNDTMVITSLAIAPPFRQSKVATSLLEDAITIARQRNGVRRLVLQVSMENIAARRLYAKFGFVKTLDLKDYYGEGKNGVEMKLDI